MYKRQIEKREHYTWRHGDAVAVGLNFAATLSHVLGHLSASDVERHRAILTSVGLPISYESDAWADLRATMNLDKKARGDAVRFVLLDGVADPFIAVAPDEAALATAYDAVSYTHLDVYKRQVRTCGARSKPASSSWPRRCRR